MSEYKNIAVWFSCGAASAVAAKKTLELYPDSNIRILNTPVEEEHPDNRRFLKDIEKWLNHPIEIAQNKSGESSAEAIWVEKKFMAQPRGASCTTRLKKQARWAFEESQECDAFVVGFTVEEKDRIDQIRSSEILPMLPVLSDLSLTKGDCFRIITEAGIRLPQPYLDGFANANCLGCVKATSPTYWNLIRKKYPDVFERRSKLSREIGCRLVRVQNERIFLDELEPNVKGMPLKDLDMQCGIFCHTQFQ